MATIDNFTDPKEGWSLISHYIGNSFLHIRLIVEAKGWDWQAEVYYEKVLLTGCLKKIVARMTEYGHTEEAAKMDQLRKMVEDGDLTNSEVTDTIINKEKELSPATRVMDEVVKKLFGEKTPH